MTENQQTELCPGLNVSRETIGRLDEFEALVRKWTKGINLVSKSSLDDLWTRHIVDSAQLYLLAPPEWRVWADIGSGGGFPGIVIAILALELKPEATITLVESDQRKATFLRTASRLLGLRTNVVSDRIENISPLGVDVLSARALSSLTQLIEMAKPHLDPQGTAIFPKGETVQSEIDAAQTAWSFDLTQTASITHPNAWILTIKGITGA
jgi:16S rRNA (guanine527-N7)-methyltransferase